LHNEERQQATSGLVQLGHDVETIICSAYSSFSFGGQPAPIHRGNSATLLLVNFGF